MENLNHKNESDFVQVVKAENLRQMFCDMTGEVTSYA